MSIILAADCGGMVSTLARLGWPGVVALGLVLFAFVAIIWALTR